jgi:hypothetical protein
MHGWPWLSWSDNRLVLDNLLIILSLILPIFDIPKVAIETSYKFSFSVSEFKAEY